jgi:rubrerythrin
MALSKEDIQKIAETSAQQVLESLHRYTVAYQEPRDVEDGLLNSMVEERTASYWYHQRAEHARRQGDKDTAELYEHVAKEEDEHYEEFRKRTKELTLAIAAESRH